MGPVPDSGRDDPVPPDDSAVAGDRARPDLSERARRRLDDVFGDVLPEVTRDEAAGQDDRPPGADDWLRANRPPHHDRD